MSGLPTPRRVVTGHEATGEVTVFDETVEMKSLLPGVDLGSIMVQQNYDPEPRSVIQGKDFQPTGLGKRGGVQARFLDLHPAPPGTEPFFHYTESIDYAVVVSGRLDLEFTDGQVAHLHAGDAVVQCATIFAIVNRYAEPCRLFIVVLPAQPNLVDGKPLDEKYGATNLSSWS